MPQRLPATSPHDSQVESVKKSGRKRPSEYHRLKSSSAGTILSFICQSWISLPFTSLQWSGMIPCAPQIESTLMAQVCGQVTLMPMPTVVPSAPAPRSFSTKAAAASCSSSSVVGTPMPTLSSQSLRIHRTQSLCARSSTRGRP